MVPYSQLRTATLRSVFAGAYAVSFARPSSAWCGLRGRGRRPVRRGRETIAGNPLNLG